MDNSLKTKDLRHTAAERGKRDRTQIRTRIASAKGRVKPLARHPGDTRVRVPGVTHGLRHARPPSARPAGAARAGRYRSPGRGMR